MTSATDTWTVFERVVRILLRDGHEALGVYPQTPISDLPLDSLEWAQFALQLEDEFKIEIYDAELLRLETVGDIVKLIENKVSR